MGWGGQGQVRDPTARPCSTFFKEKAAVVLDPGIAKEDNQIQVMRRIVRIFQAVPFQ